MIKNNFKEYLEGLIKNEKELIATKGDEYIIEDGSVDDQLANAKKISKIFGTVNIDINPIHIYFVYLFKHLFSIIKYSKDLKDGSENIDSRISDARNYLALIGALLKEMKKEEKSNNMATKEGIKTWLDEMKIEEYCINDNLTVDVDGNVYIDSKYFHDIPIQFGTVKGSVYCYNNYLTSLKFAPKKCEDFHCATNSLSYEYLKNFDFSFVKGNLFTGCYHIDDIWNLNRIRNG